jgi:type VI secretion system protein ImpK
MSDNPFGGEPDDDRTVIRPSPGGRRATPPPAAPSPPPVTGPSVTPQRVTNPSVSPPPVAPPPVAPRVEIPVTAEKITSPPISVTPLATAAAPLLELLARLRNTLHQPNASDLRERTLRELHNFERRAREAGIPMEQLRPAHIALCASIDNVVLNTPWGAASDWASKSLLASLHGATRGRDPLLDLLRQLRDDPERLRPAIELLYLCVSLGSAARDANARDPTGSYDRLREETYSLIAGQQEAEVPPLSRRWQGVPVPYRASRGGLPAWAVATVALAACGVLFVWQSTRLNAASDELQAQVLAALPAAMPQLTRAAPVQPLPPPPRPPEPTILDQLQTALQPEISKGVVTVLGTPVTPVVRINSKTMFAANSASLQQAVVPLLQRIAAALKNQPGAVQVLGYTDNQPIRTVQFPSNFQLSAARAQAVRTIIGDALGDPTRVTAEGRADADPIAPNATPAGREQNRRIEIVLRGEG